MPIIFACHDCGQPFQRAQKDAGRRARCTCGAEVIVPIKSQERVVAAVATSGLDLEMKEEKSAQRKVAELIASEALNEPLPSPSESTPPPPEFLDEDYEGILSTKICPSCAETIKAAAKKCRYCGELLDIQLRRNAAKKEKMANSPNPGIAAILSLIIPGAGSMYAGEVGIGLFLFVFTAIGYAAFILPGLILHMISVFIAIANASD